MRILRYLGLWALCGAAAASSNSSVSLSGLDWPGWSDLDKRAVGPHPVSQNGIADVIYSGITNYYLLEPGLLQQRITISICQADHPSYNLTLAIGNTTLNTAQGLLEVYLSDGVNGTLAVSAPALPHGRRGKWQYQLGVGNSSSFYSSNRGLYLVDTDFANSLLVTNPYWNLSTAVSNLHSYSVQPSAENASDVLHALFVNDSITSTQNLTLFVYPVNGTRAGVGLERSYCAISGGALLNQNNADQSTTDRGTTNAPRGQYLVKGLNASSAYDAFLGVPPTAGGLGGIIFDRVRFVTKTSMSCQVVYNMTFCSDMAFAVPGNATSFSTTELTEFYDKMAQERYLNFTRSLQQVSCDVNEDLRYSVFRNCSDCADAYRDWLCAITVPRCADWSNPASYLASRKVGQSRNPLINTWIDPGDYKEILPCRGLCFDLVRNCPSSFDFACPTGKLLDEMYGAMSDDGDVTCSYPGAVYNSDFASLVVPNWGLLLVLAVACIV